MSELIAFAIGMTAGFVMGGCTAILLLRSSAPQTPEQRFMTDLRRSQARATPEPARGLPEPWAGYEASKVDDIKWSLRPLSLAERDAVRKYEEQRPTGPRRGIINVLNALEEERVNGNA